MRTYLPISDDATIYQRSPTSNSGLDEILELGKVKNSTDSPIMYASSSARILINFDVADTATFPTSSVKYYLNLYLANAQNVNRYQSLEIYPVSRSWVEGSGYFYQDVRNASDGVTWENASETVTWTQLGGDYVTNNVSGSHVLSQVPIKNVKINITNIVEPIVQGINTIPWNGVLIKFPDADELSSTNIANIKFFSSNTHTVFSPTIEAVWQDQTFSTGSLKVLSNTNSSVVPRTLRESYTKGEISKVYLSVRDKYPDKRFDAVQRYKNNYYLPSSSYFRIRDIVADIPIQDFDQYSAIHCDATGSYILLNTSGLEIDRYYSMDLKIQSGSLVFFPEFRHTFKIDSNE